MTSTTLYLSKKNGDNTIKEFLHFFKTSDLSNRTFFPQRKNINFFRNTIKGCNTIRIGKSLNPVES